MKDKAWLENYDEGVPVTLKPYPEKTLLDVVSETAQQRPDHPALLFKGTKLFVESRVSDKISGDIGSPIQYDTVNKNWFLHSHTTNDIFTEFNTKGVNELGSKSNVSFISRTVDPRSLDERLYTVRVVVPKEAANAKDPNDGFVIQESSSTGARANTDFSASTIITSDYFSF